jgi:hypothetical protein
MTGWSVRLLADGAPQPNEFVIEDSLGYLVNRAARSMARQLAEELRPTGIGLGPWAVLLFLWARDGMTQAELSRVVAIEPPTMARTLDRMVRDRLVTRAADEADARLTRIYGAPAVQLFGNQGRIGQLRGWGARDRAGRKERRQ